MRSPTRSRTRICPALNGFALLLFRWLMHRQLVDNARHLTHGGLLTKVIISVHFFPVRIHTILVYYNLGHLTSCGFLEG